jgi:TolA-binding protein
MAAPIFDKRITLGNLITLAGMGAALAVAWGEISANMKNTQQRITAVEIGTGQKMEALERADRKQTQVADAVKERLADIGGDVKSLNERTAAQQRQLDRIERTVDFLANGRKHPALP